MIEGSSLFPHCINTNIAYNKLTEYITNVAKPPKNVLNFNVPSSI